MSLVESNNEDIIMEPSNGHIDSFYIKDGYVSSTTQNLHPKTIVHSRKDEKIAFYSPAISLDLRRPLKDGAKIIVVEIFSIYEGENFESILGEITATYYESRPFSDLKVI